MYDVDVVCAAFDEAPQNYSVIKAREGASNSGTNGAGVAYHALLSLKQAQYYDIYCATNDQVSVVSDKLTVATQFKISAVAGVQILILRHPNNHCLFSISTPRFFQLWESNSGIRNQAGFVQKSR